MTPFEIDNIIYFKYVYDENNIQYFNFLGFYL